MSPLKRSVPNMSKKEKMFYLAIIPIIAACIAGPLGWYLKNPDWTIFARNYGWVPLEDLKPDFVALYITSPGKGSEITLDFQHHFSTKIVITASKSLEESSSIGIVYKYGDSKNLNVTFPKSVEVSKEGKEYIIPSGFLSLDSRKFFLQKFSIISGYEKFLANFFSFF